MNKLSLHIGHDWIYSFIHSGDQTVPIHGWMVSTNVKQVCYLTALELQGIRINSAL